MADSELESALAKEGLAAEVIKVAIDGGWTASAFKHVVETQAEVEGAIPEIFPGHVLSRLQIAQIKAAWAGMQASSSSSVSPTPVNADPTLETWVESFAPKIASTKLSDMKRQFLANYPSEAPPSLGAVRRPSKEKVKLLPATGLGAAHQEARSEYKWIAWKHRMTEEKASELLIARPHKQPKLEMLGLSSLLLDDPPTIEVTDANMGISGIQRILAVHDVALAMVGSAHLARLKAYSCKFVQLVSQRFDPASGLRAPTILEAQQADCRIWQSIHSLVSEKAWSLNDALHEFTEIRGELSTLLQEKGGKPKGAPGRHITFVKEIQVQAVSLDMISSLQLGHPSVAFSLLASTGASCQERYLSGSGGETWNALCVSRNILTSPHKDTANLPGSSNLTVG
ncbi:unnamed protein product [Symbiodinium natans]|uniref:Uncharacterized protein n=1 Tax=Symbiodinium natans TaxID=878477 RepID=A0A812MD87_9DINO|nr:unnamed protein product [Symbiodinium natans]